MLGNGHTDTVATAFNLAITYRERGKNAEAEALEKELGGVEDAS